MATPPDFSVGQVLTAAHMNAVGLWLVKTATVTAQTTLTVSDCFTADYDNYRVVISMNGSTNDGILGMRLLDSANSPIVGTSYEGTAYGQDYRSPGTAFTTANTNNVWWVGWLPNSTSHGPMGVACDVYRPFSATTRTSMNGLHTGVRSGFAHLGGACFGMRATAEQSKGLYFFNNNSTNMTGTIRVYGYRN